MFFLVRPLDKSLHDLINGSSLSYPSYNFKQPLSIVLPISATRARDGKGDELLQRRRLGRRVFWDIVSWVSILLLGAGGSVWAIGRVLRRW